MTLSDVLSIIESNTIPDGWNELAIGRIAYKEFQIDKTDDLWRLNSAIIYRDPVITNFKKQYFQKAGLTLYTLEGTCIDIARVTQMCAMANNQWNPFIFVVFDDNLTGHAFPIIFTVDGITIFDFNKELVYPIEDGYNKFMKNESGFRSSLINQLKTFISDNQGLSFTSIYMIQIGENSPKASAVPVFLYAHDFSSDISQSLPIVGTQKEWPDSQLAVSKYIGNGNIEWKIILDLYPYALGIIIGFLILLMII